jgi:hypothetical protein
MLSIADDKPRLLAIEICAFSGQGKSLDVLAVFTTPPEPV